MLFIKNPMYSLVFSCHTVLIICYLLFRQIATSTHCEGSWLKEKLYGTSPIPTKLLNYVWTHWDHPVEVNQAVLGLQLSCGYNNFKEMSEYLLLLYKCQ